MSYYQYGGGLYAYGTGPLHLISPSNAGTTNCVPLAGAGTNLYANVNIPYSTLPTAPRQLPSLKSICRKTLFEDRKKNRELSLFKALLCRRYEIDATEIAGIEAQMAQLLK